MKIAKIALMLIAATSFIISGCEKEKTVEPKDQNTTTLQQLTKDDQKVEQVSDETFDDANLILTGGSLKSTESIPCHATVDTAILANDSITYYISYNGTNCSNTLFRTGQITITHKADEQWNEAGTTIVMKLINFHVTVLADNQSFTMNGTEYNQNVSGNNAATIIHKSWGTIFTVFDDLTTSTWNFARQRTLTGTLGTLIHTINGFGTSGSYSNLVSWGSNREGHEFFTTVNETIVQKQICDWKPCSGIKVHLIPSENKSATVTFGYNDNNEPIGPNDCPTRYRLDWTSNGYSGTFFLPLW